MSPRNSGTSLVPTIDGVTHHLDNAGQYDGLFVLRDRKIRLDGGRISRRGPLSDAEGRLSDAERPPQLFSRWHGFALSVPGTDVYGG